MTSIISIQHVYKKYRSQEVLSDVSFSMNAGEILGLVGPNGAGKTTLMKIITGLIPKYDGEIYFQNENIKTLKNSDRKRIGCVIETPGFYHNLSGYDNLLFAAHLAGVKNYKEVDEIINILGIDNFVHKKAGSYSLGMRQRLGVAQAILSYPPVLILDEPTNGLDPEVVPQLRSLLKFVSEEKQTSILISSHILSEIEQICQRVVFIKNGKILTIDALNKSETKQENCQNQIAIETSNLAILEKYLRSHHILYKVINESTVHFVYSSANVELLVADIAFNKIPLKYVYEVQDSLEVKYLKAMGDY
jgi:ABC-2 type transport system ATP-binding protein